jgi:hypothetical protein
MNKYDDTIRAKKAKTSVVNVPALSRLVGVKTINNRP